MLSLSAQPVYLIQYQHLETPLTLCIQWPTFCHLLQVGKEFFDPTLFLQTLD